MAELELGADKGRSNCIDQIGMGVPVFNHAPTYQQSVDTSSPLSLISPLAALMQLVGMSFGARLKTAIDASKYKNPRRFAIEALGWPESSGPQRLNNYINKNRLPDKAILALMASKTRTTVSYLLNDGVDDGLRDILRSLLQLSGIPGDTADTIANVAIEAKLLLEALPDEGDPQMKAQLAAHAAWRSQQPQAPDT